jgi:hypothetical protein
MQAIDKLRLIDEILKKAKDF